MSNAALEETPAALLGLSPERDQLASAIERKRAATDRLERIEAASQVTFVTAAHEKVEEAEKVLAKAKQREPHRIVAEMIGEGGCSELSVQSAQWLLEEAQAELTQAQHARQILDKQRGQAQQFLSWADQGLREAVRNVVTAEGGPDRVLYQYREAQCEVARVREVLNALSRWGCLPNHWDTVREFPATDAAGIWIEALKALAGDAETQLQD